MRYYVIAGEASGDLHGSNLIKALLTQQPHARFRAWGGDRMQQAGADVIKHYRDLAFMGFVEVLLNLRTILRNLDYCKQDIEAYKPDAIILIDYPGFNLRIAEWAHRRGYRVIYYISPQVWAWKENRVRKIREHVDQMLVILPFEKAFYQKWNYPVTYVGHPLIEVVENEWASPEGPRLSARPIVALLPGSRKQEILQKLPVMLEVTRSFPDHQFVVAQAPGQDSSFYDELLKDYPDVLRVCNQTYSLLRQSRAALVTSGTATLETALFRVPEVVCYKGSRISYEIAKRLIRHIRYISLVNLIMDREVVKELIQTGFTVGRVKKALHELLYDEDKRLRLAQDYDELYSLLKQGGFASMNAAREIVENLPTGKSGE